MEFIQNNRIKVLIIFVFILNTISLLYSEQISDIDPESFGGRLHFLIQIPLLIILFFLLVFSYTILVFGVSLFAMLYFYFINWIYNGFCKEKNNYPDSGLIYVFCVLTLSLCNCIIAEKYNVLILFE
jgi:hypothetical protein